MDPNNPDSVPGEVYFAIATRDAPGWPCGICRQVLSEFAPDLRVLVTWGDGAHTEESTLSRLLPHQFELKGKEK